MIWILAALSLIISFIDIYVTSYYMILDIKNGDREFDAFEFIFVVFVSMIPFVNLSILAAIILDIVNIFFKKINPVITDFIRGEK